MLRLAYSLRGFFDGAYLPAHQLAKLTVYHYRAAVASIDDWHKMPMAVDELCDETVSDWLLALDERGVPRTTIKSYRGKVLTLWRFAHSKQLVSTYPCHVRAVHPPKRIPRAWTFGEFERIIQAALLLPGKVGPWPAYDWWPALLLTLYDLGGRITATMHLPEHSVDLQSRWAVLQADDQKTDTDEPFSLSEQTTEALRRIWAPREKVFGDWPYDWTQHDWKSLTKVYRKILAHAGLPDGPRDLFHKLRRTTGTQVRLVAGKEIAAACLRHKQISTFERNYNDTTQGAPISAANYLPRPKMG